MVLQDRRPRLPDEEPQPRDGEWDSCGFGVPASVTGVCAGRLVVAALQILLARYTGSEDITVAVSARVAGREASGPEASGPEASGERMAVKSELIISFLII